MISTGRRRLRRTSIQNPKKTVAKIILNTTYSRTCLMNDDRAMNLAPIPARADLPIAKVTPEASNAAPEEIASPGQMPRIDPAKNVKGEQGRKSAAKATCKPM